MRVSRILCHVDFEAAMRISMVFLSVRIRSNFAPSCPGTKLLPSNQTVPLDMSGRDFLDELMALQDVLSRLSDSSEPLMRAQYSQTATQNANLLVERMARVRMVTCQEVARIMEELERGPWPTTENNKIVTRSAIDALVCGDMY